MTKRLVTTAYGLYGSETDMPVVSVVAEIMKGGKNVIDLSEIKAQLMIIGMGVWALVIVEAMKWLWT